MNAMVAVSPLTYRREAVAGSPWLPCITKKRCTSFADGTRGVEDVHTAAMFILAPEPEDRDFGSCLEDS